MKKSLTEINDAIRGCVPLMPQPHKLILTEGVATLTPEQLGELFCKVRNFKQFTTENDPYKEHDFGCINLFGEKFFFKFDYYDSKFESFKDNGNRVLTIMYANEY
jgi:hypothetical protein